jgi:hypothetical protein
VFRRLISSLSLPIGEFERPYRVCIAPDGYLDYRDNTPVTIDHHDFYGAHIIRGNGASIRMPPTDHRSGSSFGHSSNLTERYAYLASDTQRVMVMDLEGILKDS